MSGFMFEPELKRQKSFDANISDGTNQNENALKRTVTMQNVCQVGNTCVPTSLGNVIMHNICTVLKIDSDVCKLLNQQVFDMILNTFTDCVNSGVNAENAIDYVIRTFNNFFNSVRNETFARTCKLKVGTHTEDLVGMSNSSDTAGLFKLLKHIQKSISNILQIRIKSTDVQNNKGLIQEYCKSDWYSLIKVNGYNNTLTRLITGGQENFYPNPSFNVFGNNDPITVFQHSDSNNNQGIIDNFMGSYLNQADVNTTFQTIRDEQQQPNPEKTMGHAMVLKALFTYHATDYMLIKNSFGEEWSLYDEHVSGLNGHIILPVDLLPEYTIFMLTPVLSGRKGGKPNSRRRTRKRRTHKKKRVNRKKTHRK